MKQPVDILIIDDQVAERQCAKLKESSTATRNGEAVRKNLATLKAAARRHRRI